MYAVDQMECITSIRAAAPSCPAILRAALDLMVLLLLHTTGYIRHSRFYTRNQAHNAILKVDQGIQHNLTWCWICDVLGLACESHLIKHGRMPPETLQSPEPALSIYFA